MEAPRTRSQVGRGDGVPLHPRGRVPQLYDRGEDHVTLDEVVKINIRGSWSLTTWWVGSQPRQVYPSVT